MNLQGRHILVTGAAKRVGRAIAESFLPYGVSLSLHYFRSEIAESELLPLAEKGGSRFFSVQADLCDVNSIRAAVQLAEAKFGPVDILVNSASTFYPTPVLSVTEEQWDELVDANVKGHFFFSQACAPQMSKRGGVILNIGDVNAERPVKNFTPYVVGKAGLLMLTKNLAKEWAPAIRVNAISPGPVLIPEGYTPEKIERAAEKTLLKRWGTPEDIVQAVHFLIRNEYITGFNLRVDGGKSILS